jgi:UDP-N-acetylglucosamine acyltransferase
VIHLQAIIDPGAHLGTGVAIGAFSIIGPEVEIGDNTRIGPHVVIQGATRIGHNNRIYQFCSLGEPPQHLAYKGEPTRLEIGDGNTIREYCSLNRGTVDGGGVTRIGNDNFIMAYCHVAHDCQVGNKCVFANGVNLAGHVLIEDQVVFGGFTLVHQYVRIGAHIMTGVATVAYKDIPPFVMATGNGAEPHGLNLRGLKRRGFSEQAIEAIRRAYKILYRSNNTLEEALTELAPLGEKVPEVGHFVRFIRESDRGIIR